MRKYLIIICFLLGLQMNWAQKGLNSHSIIHHRNGSVYIGKVLGSNESLIQMQLLDGNTVDIPWGAVTKYLPAGKILLFDDGKYHVTHGKLSNIGFGFNIGDFFEGDDALVSTHIPYIFGFQLSPKVALGAGIAFEFNEARISGFKIDTQFIPLFAYGRYYLSETKKRPFAYARIGYGFKADDDQFANDHSGGIQFQGGMGLQFASRKKMKMVLSLGYHLQKTNGSERFIDLFGNEIITAFDILIRRIVFTVGFEFQKPHKNKL